MVFNAHGDLVEFGLPEAAGGGEWQLLIDTNLPDDADMAASAPAEHYEVTGRSLLLFVLSPGTER